MCGRGITVGDNEPKIILLFLKVSLQLFYKYLFFYEIKLSLNGQVRDAIVRPILARRLSALLPVQLFLGHLLLPQGGKALLQTGLRKVRQVKECSGVERIINKIKIVQVEAFPT